MHFMDGRIIKEFSGMSGCESFRRSHSDAYGKLLWRTLLPNKKARMIKPISLFLSTNLLQQINRLSFINLVELFHIFCKKFYRLDGAGIVNGSAHAADGAMSFQPEHFFRFRFGNKFLFQLRSR